MLCTCSPAAFSQLHSQRTPPSKMSSAEMSTTGVGTKRAEDMAHLPVGGPAGGLARLAALRARRRVLIHINNTNPLLREDSAERAQADASGVEVAVDGLEIAL